MPQIPNAYVRFFKHAGDLIKKENPKLENVKVVEEIARRWKNMDSTERKPFVDAAQKETDAENERIATARIARAATHNEKKVHVVFTIETCDSGDNFIMERVFSGPKGVDAYKHKFELEFKYNTEYHSDKDKTEWESDLKKLLVGLNKNNLSDVSKKLEALRVKFSTNGSNAVDLPTYITHVKIMTVDNDNDSERKEYNYC